MATFTSNFALTKPAYGEAADIAVINADLDEIDEIMHDNRYMMASAWDSATTYNKGDFAIYENSLYRCTTDGTSGNWDASKWTLTVLADNIGSVTVSKTASGNPLSFADGADAPVVRCETEIQGSQDLHGYDKPWAGGAGKNKLIDSGYVQGVLGWNEATAENIVANTHFISSPYMPINDNTAYTLSAIQGVIVRIYVTDENHNKLYFLGNNPQAGSNVLIPATSGAVYLRISIGIDDDAVIPSDYGTKVYGQLETGSSATAFQPYSNICPITAYSTGTIEISDEDSNTTTYTTTFPSTIYLGSEDVAEGEVTTEKKKMVLNGSASETYTHNSSWVDGAYIMTNALTDAVQVSGYVTIANLICNQTVAERPSLIVTGNSGIGQGEGSSLYINLGAEYDTEAKLKTYLANNPLEIVYELATPTTSTVTVSNSPIRTLSGYNHIESSTGEMEVEYITQTYQPLVDCNSIEHTNYTTAEKIVGTWIDGKPIYEQILHINSGWQATMIIPVANLKYLLSYWGFGIYGTTYSVPLSNYYVETLNKFQLYGRYNEGIQINTGSAFYSTYDNVYLVIRYTKTTD